VAPYMACIICKSDQEKKAFFYKSTQYYKCKGCGLIRTLPFPSNDELIVHYQRGFDADNYSILSANKDVYTHIYKQYLNIIKGTIELRGKKILDIGCFTGDFLDMAKNEGALTFGVELQDVAAAIANEKHSGRILNCDVNNAVFKEKFDIITAFGLIEHIKKPEGLLRLAYSNLVEGGLLVLQTPNSGSLSARLLGKYWPPYTPVEHIHHFSSSNIKLFLKNFNFIDISVSPHFKQLSVEYVYAMLQTFGTEFYSLFTPIFNCLPRSVKKMILPFYGGEMIVLARTPVK